MTYLITHCPAPEHSTLLYCLLSYEIEQSEANVSSLTLRLLISQALRKWPHLLPYVYDNYVKVGLMPSTQRVSEILSGLLRLLNETYIVLDGLDEIQPKQQKSVLKELFSLQNASAAEGRETTIFKILISSRQTKTILPQLKRASQICLSTEQRLVSSDIAIFTKNSLNELRERFDNAEELDKIERSLVTKSDGG